MLNDNLTPVDVTARLVIQKGTRFNAEDKRDYGDSENPLKTRLIPIKTNGFIDLTGCVADRITVIGLSFKKGCWVVRCSCGMYSLRNTKSLKRSIEKKSQNQCGQCNEKRHLRRFDEFKRFGFNKD